MNVLALQGGGYAKRSQKDLVIIDPPSNMNLRVGDLVPAEWSYVPVTLDPQRFTSAMRDGYETGLANKADPNAYVETSRFHAEWQSGYNLGCAERLSYDEAEHDGVCDHCRSEWPSCVCDGGTGRDFY